MDTGVNTGLLDGDNVYRGRPTYNKVKQKQSAESGS